MNNERTSPDWEVEAVLGRMEAEAADPDALVSAQLFLAETVPADSIKEVVRDALEAAARSTGSKAGPFDLGKPRALAHSISAVAPVSVLREAMKSAALTGLLPGDLPGSEVFIAPYDKM